jgi:hypothetical protein
MAGMSGQSGGAGRMSTLDDMGVMSTETEKTRFPLDDRQSSSFI